MEERALTQEEIIAREWKIYRDSLEDKNIDKDKSLWNRETKTLEEYDFNMPQTIFYLENDDNDEIIVGRKTLSDLYRTHELKSLNCSKIMNNMLLGVLQSSSYENRKITIQYYPFTNREKRECFEHIKNHLRNYNLFYPYRFRFFESNEEQTSSDLVWNANEEIAKYLSRGEKHIREYTNEMIDKYQLTPNIVYDPACSTGEFLWNIKKKIPSCKTIGHDLSKQMVEYSRPYVDESGHYDAFSSPIKSESVDLLVLRFLNGGVVTTKDAEELFPALIEKVKKNGHIICIGHTPILVTTQMFIDNYLDLLEKIGQDHKTDSIFQYYLAKRR